MTQTTTEKHLLGLYVPRTAFGPANRCWGCGCDLPTLLDCLQRRAVNDCAEAHAATPGGVGFDAALLGILRSEAREVESIAERNDLMKAPVGTIGAAAWAAATAARSPHNLNQRSILLDAARALVAVALEVAR